jgi:hypothetical protein
MDPFNPDIIIELNRSLKCRDFEFFYKIRTDYSRQIGIKYKGKEISYIYLNPPEGQNMVLELSKTLHTTVDGKKINFEKRHLNTCLRYLAAMIASKHGCYLVSEAINPVSLYTMLKLFNCEIETQEGFIHQPPLNKDESAQLFHHLTRNKIYVTIRADTIRADTYDVFARSLFESIESIRCTDLGGTRKLRVRNQLLHHKSKHAKHRKSTIV